jgi:hypothetical protein
MFGWSLLQEFCDLLQPLEDSKTGGVSQTRSPVVEQELPQPD